jgi:hemerythrin-like domain-containing protein
MWNEMYSTCTKNKRPSGQSIRAFLSLAESFCSQLNLHHAIEERHLFPELAVKMPEFRKDLVGQHREIHNGLDKMDQYVKMCRTGEKELQLTHLKMLMDGFGGVLWEHLDDEVKALGAENMRQYWTLEEMVKLYH